MGSLTTSLFLVVETTRFWSTVATAEHVPNGATGDSSIPVNSSGRRSHRRLSTRHNRRGSLAAGWTYRSSRQRGMSRAGVTIDALLSGRAKRDSGQLAGVQPPLQSGPGIGESLPPDTVYGSARIGAVSHRAPALIDEQEQATGFRCGSCGWGLADIAIPAGHRRGDGLHVQAGSHERGR